MRATLLVLAATIALAGWSLLAAPEAQAQADRRWTGGAAPDNRWTVPSNWQGNEAPVAGDRLYFPAGAAQLTTDNNYPAGTQFGTITIEASGYNLTGNAIQLSGGLVAGQSSGTSEYALSTTLTAAQTWLVANPSASLEVTSLGVNLNGHTLTLDSQGTTAMRTLIGTTVGTPGLTKIGIGTVLLTGNNSYPGNTLINGGTVRIAHANALGATTAGTTVASGAMLQVEGDITVAEPLVLNGTGVGGTGALQSSGTNTWTGNVTLDATVAVNSGTLTIGGAVGGAALTKTGGGTLTLSGNNTYSGATTVQAGVLRITNTGALGTSGAGTTVASGTSLQVGGGITVAEPLVLNGAGVGGAGALHHTDSCTSCLPAVWQGTVTLATNTAIGVAGSGEVAIWISGAIGGPGGLTKVGGGALVLRGTAPNTYLGATTVNEGQLVLDKSTGTAAVPGNLTIGDGVGSPAADEVLVQGADQIADNAAVTLASSGRLSIRPGAETIGSLAGAGAVQLSLQGGDTSVLTVGSNNLSTTFSGTIADGLGPGALIKVGTGTLTLAGNNSYSGATTVQAGVLKITHANALGSTAAGTTVQSGATLRVEGGLSVAEPLVLNGAGVGGAGALYSIVGEKEWTGPITLASDATVAVVGASALTISGPIDGPGSLTKTGNPLRLAGNNSYSGATTVQGGLLTITHANALGSTAAGTTVQSGATLRVEGGLSVAEPLVLNGAGVGGTAVGALQSTSGSNTWSGGIALASDSEIGVFEGAPLTISGAIGGTGAVTKQGFGLLTLSANNTYTGLTTVRLGLLTITHANALGSTAAGTTVQSRGTLRVEGGLTVAEPLTLNGDGEAGAGALDNSSGSNTWSGGITLASDSEIVVADGAALTISGAIGAAGGLTKRGPGTLTLAANNIYTGQTVVGEGTLVVTGSLTNSAVAVLNPGTVNGGTLAGTGTVKGITAIDYARVSPGTGGPGVLTSNGNVVFYARSSFVVELNGTAAGSGHDQLAVTGTISLGGATLNATLGFTPAVGDRFTIISNDGTDPVQGTFAGLAEGATLAIGGQGFQISYKGGDGGNDVVLTRVAPCTVRPNVRLPVEPTGDGRLRVTVHAGADPATNRLLQSLQFTRLDNAVIEIGGTTLSAPGTHTVSPPTASLTFFVRRGAQGTTQATTAHFTVTDTCGTWPTFVGGGPAAF